MNSAQKFHLFLNIITEANNSALINSIHEAYCVCFENENRMYTVKHTRQPYNNVIHNWNTFNIYADSDTVAHKIVNDIINEKFSDDVFRIFEADKSTNNSMSREIKYLPDAPHFSYREKDGLAAVAYEAIPEPSISNEQNADLEFETKYADKVRS